MTFLNILFSHQTEAVETTAEPVIIREDFTISNADQMSVRDLLQMLRDRTYEFALDNGLTSATTEFSYIDDLPLVVKLTESYDFLYTVNRFSTYSVEDAIAVIADVIRF